MVVLGERQVSTCSGKDNRTLVVWHTARQGWHHYIPLLWLHTERGTHREGKTKTYLTWRHDHRCSLHTGQLSQKPSPTHAGTHRVLRAPERLIISPIYFMTMVGWHFESNNYLEEAPLILMEFLFKTLQQNLAWCHWINYQWYCRYSGWWKTYY